MGYLDSVPPENIKYAMNQDNTLDNSSNQSHGNFIILAKLSNIQKIPEFQNYVFDVRSKF